MATTLGFVLSYLVLRFHCGSGTLVNDSGSFVLIRILIFAGNGYIEGTELDNFLREFIASVNNVDTGPEVRFLHTSCQKDEAQHCSFALLCGFCDCSTPNIRTPLNTTMSRTSFDGKNVIFLTRAEIQKIDSRKLCVLFSWQKRNEKGMSRILNVCVSCASFAKTVPTNLPVLEIGHTIVKIPFTAFHRSFSFYSDTKLK